MADKIKKCSLCSSPLKSVYDTFYPCRHTIHLLCVKASGFASPRMDQVSPESANCPTCRSTQQEEAMQYIKSAISNVPQGSRFQTVAHALQLVSEDQLMKVMHLSNSQVIFRDLDNQLACRLSKWSKSTALDYLKELNKLFPDFESVFSDSCATLFPALEDCSSEEFLLVMHLASRNKELPGMQGVVEECFKKHFDTYSLQETGTICIGFVRANASIRTPDIVDRLARTLKSSVQEMDNRTISAFLKILQKSADWQTFSWEVLELPLELAPHVNSMDVMAMVRLVCVCSNMSYFSSTAIEDVLTIFPRLKTEARLKDMERLASAVFGAGINIAMPSVQNFWNSVEEELMTSKREEELKKYPGSFIALVSYAVSSTIYKNGLLGKALDSDMIRLALENSRYRATRADLLVIIKSLEVELPNYSGPKPLRYQLQELENYLIAQRPAVPHHLMRRPTDQENLILKIDAAAEQLAPSEIAYAHPFSTVPDVIINFNGKKICFVAARKRAFLFCTDPPRPLGFLAMKMRQLRALSYCPVLVSEGNLEKAKEDGLSVRQLLIDLIRNNS